MNITEVIQENQRTSTSQVDNADAAGAAIQRQHDYMKNQEQKPRHQAEIQEPAPT